MGKLYFVDGYHGGIRGHMPVGAWQDILHALEEWPNWKISLEIEPESFEHLRIHQPDIYRRLQAFVAREDGRRVEIISGSYAQPFCWAINGESNIRQLLLGRAAHAKHFPKAVIDTYAVQEPCFTSSLPQLLNLLGYQRMSLKNPTAWGGYMAKMPGAVVRLKGSDGSVIPTVPRYECEELFSCSATVASGYDFEGIQTFADRCIAHGIEAPVGMCLQDLGWSAKPHVRDIDVEYVTWREYFERFGDRIDGDVPFTQDDIRVSLPWGNRLFQQMLRTVRHAENRILQTEKLLAIAEAEHPDAPALRRAREQLLPAWQMLAQAQHHDGYICATTREGTQQWAFQSSALTQGCEQILDEADAAVWETLGTGQGEPAHPSERWLRVYNTTGSERTDSVSLSLGLDHGCNDVEVCDQDGQRVESQFLATRTYRDGCVGTARLTFQARVGGLGYACYRVVPKAAAPAPVQPLLLKTNQLFLVEAYTDYAHIVFDLAKGGTIVKWVDRETGRDFGGSGFGALRGYSVKLGRFVSSAECDAKGEILENGPLQATLRISGTFAGIEFQNTVTVRRHSRRVDFNTRVRFAEKTDIGFPYEPTEEERYLGTRRSSCREEYKLGVCLPMGSLPVQVSKSAAFDVCDSPEQDTRFDSWDTIKHTVVNGYLDFHEAVSNTGFAVFCDQVTGYSLVENTATLTVAFGYHANFWWGYQLLEGLCTLSYSLLPHRSNWREGGVPQEDAHLREPLRAQELASEPARKSAATLTTGNPAVELVTVLREGDATQVRLFNHSNQAEPLALDCALSGFTGQTVDLLNQPMTVAPDTLRPFEVRTLQ